MNSSDDHDETYDELTVNIMTMIRLMMSLQC